jgi:hypothetical protein
MEVKRDITYLLCIIETILYVTLGFVITRWRKQI